MFDLIFSGVQAYNQIGFFIGALVCLGLGGLLLGNSLYWRVHSLHAAGTVVGVITNNSMYTRVYRYTLPDGETHEAKSDTGRGWLGGSETGRIVPLLISAHNPTEAREANSYLMEIIGLVIVAPGVAFGYVALTAYPTTWMTGIMAVAMLLYLAEHGRRILIPKGQRLSIAEWRKQHGLDDTTAIDMEQVKPAEAILGAPGIQQTRQSQWQTKAAPFLLLFAVVLIGLALYQANKTWRLETAGVRAPGEVVRLNAEESSDSTSYYPVVRYRTQANETVEFKDSIGSNPPSYRSGDKVTVLYLAANPQRQAIIDRGFWNWAIPAILLFAALFLACISIAILRNRTRLKPVTAT